MITTELILLKSKVKRILLKNLYSRDNDAMLYHLVWQSQIKNIDDISYSEFIKKLKNNDLFSPKSILRTRQKVQELYPKTRGVLYFERRNMQEEAKEILEVYKRI